MEITQKKKLNNISIYLFLTINCVNIVHCTTVKTSVQYIYI